MGQSFLGLQSTCLATRRWWFYQGAGALSRVLPGSMLEELRLNGNPLGPAGGVALAAGVAGSATLQRLHLNATGIADEGART
jgi:Leucine Rich repeat